MESALLTSAHPEIGSEDWQRTPPRVQQVMLRLIERVATLEQEVSSLRAGHEPLREQTRRSSHHSSPPPSSDAPSVPPRQRRKASGRKRGAQPGHEGHQRTRYPVEACQSVTDHRPAQCGTCGSALSGDDLHPYRHQVVALPEVKPLVDAHRLHQLCCPTCGDLTRAPWPVEVSASGYGPRLVATVGMLSGPYRQSARQTQHALEDFSHVDVALGTINPWRHEVSAAVAEPVREATACAQAQDVAHADATGWVQGHSDGANPERRQAWLWVLVTSWVTIFQVHLSRSHVAATALLGTCAGSLVTDRWAGDGRWPLDRRQVGWAQLSRDFHKIAARGGASQRIGEGWLAQARQWLQLWHRVRDGTMTRAVCAAAVVEIRATLQQGLATGADDEAARGDKSARARTARTCRELLKVEEALWLFVRVEGVEPTHNAAERAWRPAVIWRRTSFGTQSAPGSQCVARMLTVMRTLRVQQRPVLEYLTTACEAARQGLSAPSLLPDCSLLEPAHHLPIAA